MKQQSNFWIEQNAVIKYIKTKDREHMLAPLVDHAYKIDWQMLHTLYISSLYTCVKKKTDLKKII